MDDLFSPRARASDPATSHEAAASMEQHIGPQHSTILRCLADRPGLSSAEVDTLVGFNTWRRCSELKQQGYIRPIGTTKNPASGRSAETFVLTERAYNLPV